MLRIKDNVDLKELKKFGFKPVYDINTGKLNNMYYEVEVDIFIYRIMIIPYKEEKQETYYSPFTFFKRKKIKSIELPHSFYRVELNDYGCLLSDKTLDIIYDLIKADLVEKVEEK